MSFDPSVLINLGLFVGSIAAAAVWLRSTLVKQRHEELELLVETRGNRIKDQDDRISELELRVANLAGQVETIQRLKAIEIADEVVARLNNRSLLNP